METRVLKNQHMPIAAQTVFLHVIPEYPVAHLDWKEASAA